MYFFGRLFGRLHCAALELHSTCDASSAGWTAIAVNSTCTCNVPSRQTFVFFSGDFCHLLGRLHSITTPPRQTAPLFCLLPDKVPCKNLMHPDHLPPMWEILLLTYLLPLLEILIQICLKWRKREEEKLLARAVLWVRCAYVSVQIYAETYSRFHIEYRAVHNATHWDLLWQSSLRPDSLQFQT